ncbi:MAG TPA: UDP-N-acetylmuramate dehydrogenase [Bryobacteraceae bacterium]|nr:UDP-N-acetylmuramate dehydrogenase [Bryobacteraceae bacterium]
MTLPQAVLDRLGAVEGLLVLPGAPLRHHTRFRLGGPSWLLADASTSYAFEEAYRTLAWSHLRWTSIGRGTNLIVSDDGYPGAILRYSANSISHDGPLVTVDAGAELNDLIDYANSHGLAGMESMAGIPGWAGAAIYGNAGAYGQSIHQRIESVRFFDGETIREWSNEECGFRYRHSQFKKQKGYQILSARLRFQSGDAAALSAQSQKIRAARDAKFPPSMACAGSIFKNLLLHELPESARAAVPPNKVIEGKVPAGWFLEEVGAKGMQIGGIQVADYHANLIYNTGDGTAADLLALLAALKNRVREKFGFLLEEEVQFVGFHPDWILPPSALAASQPINLTPVLTEDNPVLTDLSPQPDPAALLRLIPQSAASRPCVHPTRGPLTLQDLL